MFKSKVENVYNYKDVNVSNELLDIKVSKKEIIDSLNSLAKKYAVTVEPDDVVRKGDKINLVLKSDLEKYNKKNVPIVVGMGLFNKDIEDKLIGMKKEELQNICVDGNTVTVKVLNISRKVVPDVTDDMVNKLGIQDVNTVDDYKSYCYNEKVKKEKEKRFDTIYPMVRDETVKKSEFSLVNEDIQKLIEVELDRCRTLAKKEGLIFEEMTREQFMIRVPAGNVEEFKIFLRKDFNEELKWMLIGMKLAETEKVEFNEATYNESMAKSASKDGTDVETEKKEYPYLKYIVNSYGRYYMDKIRQHFDSKFTCSIA